MFHTSDEWEGGRGSQLIGELFGQPGLRRYRGFQVPLNLQLFHVDLAIGTGNELEWLRWMFDSFDDVMELLSNEHAVKVRVSLQTRRHDDRGYEIIRIREVLTVSTQDGRSSYIFVGVDESRYPDTYWDPVGNGGIEFIESFWKLDDFA